MNNRVASALTSNGSPEWTAQLPERSRKPRVALYSHDTVGLGHMRRNLLIAQTLMRSESPPVTLMVSGAREASTLPLPRGVDCVTLPALTKDNEGRLKARDLDLTMPEIVKLRSWAVAAVLEAFEPDALIVDKVPRGATFELDLGLQALRAQGRCRCVLGLRDILDDPDTVRREWREAEYEDAIRRFYDAVWVYGDPVLYDQVREYGFSPDVALKIRYTGYLDQRLRLPDGAPDGDCPVAALGLPSDCPVILCQLGGGHDGASLAEAFVNASFPPGSSGVLLTGHYLPSGTLTQIRRAASERPWLRVLEFVAEPSRLIRCADRVITMGGYNAVCEVLSFGKPALIVPRIHPRREQWIRAERFREHGVIDVLHPEQLSAEALSRWLARHPVPRPSVRGLFDWDGLAKLPQFLNDLLTTPPLSAVTSCPPCENHQCHALTPSASATS
jgi:predicted glycosyltransferase